MKRLSELLINKHNNIEQNIQYVKEDYVENNEIICQHENGTILTDFDEFITENNITNINEGTYLFFLDSIFNITYKYIDNPYTYGKFQEQTYIFETLLHSWDAHKLYSKLYVTFKDKIINVKYIDEKKKL